jgi:hypothetical protein
LFFQINLVVPNILLLFMCYPMVFINFLHKKRVKEVLSS